MDISTQLALLLAKVEEANVILNQLWEYDPSCRTLRTANIASMLDRVHRMVEIECETKHKGK